MHQKITKRKFNKRMILLLVVAIIALPIWSKPITETAARNVATQILLRSSVTTHNVDSTTQLKAQVVPQKTMYPFIVIFIVIIGIQVIWIIRKIPKYKEESAKMLEQYGLTISELIPYRCRYAGGHPDRDQEAYSIVVGAKRGKLIFFTTNIAFSEGKNFSANILIPNIAITPKLIYLFDIPINSIAEIRYFDATTSRPAGYVIGDYWAIPINMKKGDASVLIDWNDGSFNHSTEFRFEGLVQGVNANRRANTLRNMLIRMAKENA